MKQVFTFIVLLCHINFTMFFPTVEEHDVYDTNGVMVDEINSVYEYVDEILLGNIDTTPEDEDDDEPHFYQVVKVGDYYQQEVCVQLIRSFKGSSEKIVYPNYYRFAPLSLAYDIIVPPPEA